MAQPTADRLLFMPDPGFNIFHAPIQLRDIFGMTKPASPDILGITNSGSPRQDTVLGLDFEHYRFVEADGCKSTSYTHITPQQVEEYRNYFLVRLTFPMQVIGPFVTICCQDGIPSESERPFFIGGCIALWGTSRDLCKGLSADKRKNLRTHKARLDPPIFPTITKNQLLPSKTVRYLANHVFPGSNAISIFPSYRGGEFLIELPKTTEATHIEHLKRLPSRIKNIPYRIFFHNGPLESNLEGSALTTHTNPPKHYQSIYYGDRITFYRHPNRDKNNPDLPAVTSPIRLYMKREPHLVSDCSLEELQQQSICPETMASRYSRQEIYLTNKPVNGRGTHMFDYLIFAEVGDESPRTSG